MITGYGIDDVCEGFMCDGYICSGYVRVAFEFREEWCLYWEFVSSGM